MIGNKLSGASTNTSVEKMTVYIVSYILQLSPTFNTFSSNVGRFLRRTSILGDQLLQLMMIIISSFVTIPTSTHKILIIVLWNRSSECCMRSRGIVLLCQVGEQLAHQMFLDCFWLLQNHLATSIIPVWIFSNKFCKLEWNTPPQFY